MAAASSALDLGYVRIVTAGIGLASGWSAAATGEIKDAVWQSAGDWGWSDTQLAESFAYLGVVIFPAPFMRFAESEPDPALAAVPA